MLQLLLPAIETLLNRYLKLDPEVLQSVAKLQGQIIQIEINDWGIILQLHPTDTGFQITGAGEEAACIIKGKLLDFMEALSKSSKTARVAQRALSVRGDVELAHSVQKIFKQIDIDWEEHLSHYVGDVFAHKSFALGKKITKSFFNLVDVFRRNTQEFIQEEISVTPSSRETEKLYRNITTLRDDVERMEARVERLSAKRKRN